MCTYLYSLSSISHTIYSKYRGTRNMMLTGTSDSDDSDDDASRSYAGDEDDDEEEEGSSGGGLYGEYPMDIEGDGNDTSRDDEQIPDWWV